MKSGEANAIIDLDQISTALRDRCHLIVQAVKRKSIEQVKAYHTTK
jgi:hypothetical protein